jgi:hypothetical protein
MVSERKDKNRDSVLVPRGLRIQILAGLVSVCLACLFCGFVVPGPALAQQQWSFSVISDVHAQFRSYQNVLNEMKSPTAGRGERLGIPDFVVGLGDFSPVSENHRLFRETFPKMPPVFFPTRGNHETAQDLSFIRSVIFPEALHAGHGVNLLGGSGFSYWVDWKNTRLIVLDQYADFQKRAVAPKSLSWLISALETAGGADHVFLAFHEPYFPWHAEDDPPWKILLKYRSRITAILFGHTHFYNHTRYPDSHAGIHVINAGNAGESRHSDLRQTIVNVMVKGRSAWVRTVQTPDARARFGLSDGFNLD